MSNKIVLKYLHLVTFSLGIKCREESQSEFEFQIFVKGSIFAFLETTRTVEKKKVPSLYGHFWFSVSGKFERIRDSKVGGGT